MESTFFWNPESTAWNPESKTVLDFLTWGEDLRLIHVSGSAVKGKVSCEDDSSVLDGFWSTLICGPAMTNTCND